VEVVLTARRFGHGYLPWAVGYVFAAANVGVACFGAVLGFLVDRIGLEVVAPTLVLVAVAVAVVTKTLERLSVVPARSVLEQAP
jgi:hypothetical protein